MKTGILALQGSFYEHATALNQINKDYILIKRPEDLNKIDSLILPGGESTAMLKIEEENNLFENIKTLIDSGIPTLGTCAGLILLSTNDVLGKETLQSIDCSVERNSYGRQNQSFEALVKFNDFTGVYCFIRAPKIINYGEDVKPIAFLGNEVVGIQENNVVGLSFHPELTNDVHYLEWLESFILKGSHVGTL